MRVEHILGVLLLVGCDVVFRIDAIDGEQDGQHDADVGEPDAPLGCEQITSHDEDGDTVTDACDVCPGTPDDQSDSDGDGVGDACDPNNSTQDRLALFVTFAESSAPNDWEPIVGTWSVDGEDLLHTSPSTANRSIVGFKRSIPEPPYVLEIRLTVLSISTLSSVFAIVADANDEHRGVQCALFRYENPTRDAVRADYANVAPNETNLSQVTPDVYRMTMSYEEPGPLRCTFGATATMISLPQISSTGRLVLQSQGVAARIHHLAIYTRE